MSVTVSYTHLDVYKRQMEQTVTTCEGQTIKPDLDSQAIAHIERRQSRSSVDVSVAWLKVL